MVRAARSGNDSPEGRHSSVNGGSIPSPACICFALLSLIETAHADTWVKCKPGTLIRTEPEPRCVGEIVSECPPCPMLDDDPTEHTRPCPPCSVHSDENLAQEWEQKYLRAKTERDGFATLHQREAADNRRCKNALKKCRRRR